MSTVNDFEVHPIGTGRQLAELSDKLQDLRAALESVISWTNDDVRPIERRELMARNAARAALQKLS